MYRKAFHHETCRRLFDFVVRSKNRQKVAINNFVFSMSKRFSIIMGLGRFQTIEVVACNGNYEVSKFGYFLHFKVAMLLHLLNSDENKFKTKISLFHRL